MLWDRDSFESLRHRHSLLPTLAALSVDTPSKRVGDEALVNATHGYLDSGKTPSMSTYQPIWSCLCTSFSQSSLQI